MSSPRTSSALAGARPADSGGLRRGTRGGLARTLLIVLLPLILGPLITFAALIYRQVRGDITRQITAQLTTLASVKDAQLDQWATSRVSEINSLALQRDVIDAARAVMIGSGSSGSFAQTRLSDFLRANPYYEAIMLADAEAGTVRVSTLQFQYDRFVGQTFLSEMDLARARTAPFMGAPVYDERLGDVQVLIVAPIVAGDQGTIGLVLAFVRDEQLLDIVAPSPGLSTAGRSYIVTGDGYQLASFAMAGAPVAETEGIRRAIRDHTNGNGRYLNPVGQEVLGAFRWLPEYGLAILVEEGTAEAFAPLQRFTTALLIIAAGTIVVSGAGVFLVTGRLITGPLHALTEGAQRLAGGDLTAMVSIKRRDEVGVLGSAFNRMATELGGLYQDLEAKVEARTQQLAAAAEVGRAATSILNPDELMARSVELIRDRFGYYHVSVFLLDPTGRWAVLRESTGEVGALLKSRGHRLAVGSTSLIGWVTVNRKARIALDVGGDEVYFQNELLPDTRSEAALPLRVGERLIGALDVQSRTLNAFNEADIEVLQVVADQIAVALENGRLFAHQERVAQLEQRVAALTARIHKSLTLDAILESAASELGQAFGAHKVVVRLAPEAQPVLGAAPAPASGNGSSPGPNGHAPNGADSAPV